MTEYGRPVTIEIAQSETVFQKRVMLGFRIQLQGTVVHAQFCIKVGLFAIGYYDIRGSYAVGITADGFLINGDSFFIFSDEAIINTESGHDAKHIPVLSSLPVSFHALF
ncbi:unknown [Bacteroides intestinalis CAG:564]|nr:unknown [Bacteroides intestinalis CAG:564]